MWSRLAAMMMPSRAGVSPVSIQLATCRQEICPCRWNPRERTVMRTPAALEVQVLGRARIRKAFPSPASASVVGCFPRGEEAGQLLAGHVVQGDREVAVRGRGLRWLGVIVVSRPGVRGTGGGPGVLPARSGRAGRGRVWRRGGWLVFFRAGARVRTVRVRVVLPGGSGGSELGRVRRSGLGVCCGAAAFAAGRPAPAGGQDRTVLVAAGGTPWRGCRPGWRAVLRRVVEQGLLDRACSHGRRGGRGPARRARAAARPRSRPRRRRRPRSGAGWPACPPPRWER